MREFFLPRKREWSWLAIVVSLALHAVVLFFRIPKSSEREPKPVTISFPVGTEGIQTVPMTYDPEPSAGTAKEIAKRSGPKKTPVVAPAPIVAAPVDTGTLAIEETAKDTVPTRSDSVGKRRVRPRIRPARGDGRLWVPPISLLPTEYGNTIFRQVPPALDSLVREIVQHLVDSMLAKEPATAPAPKWSLPLGDGKEAAIDEKWITLGPLKVPTAAVLGIMQALGALPKGMSAEATDFTRFRSLQQMREDLQRAAHRSQTMADFKQALADLRAERERVKEFKRNQKTPPKKQSDSTERKKQ